MRLRNKKIPVERVPYPPNNTLANDLFIALHIIYERMPPEKPTRAPTIVRRSFCSINPSAHNAHPL